MPKTIIFCADGTWNGPDEVTGKSASDGNDDAGELQGNSVTNVVKLYSNLAGRPTPQTLMLHNEQEKLALDASGKVVQVAKYLHGVGDSNLTSMKVLGGVFGVGVIARIVRGYTFISRHYEPGDEIHILGFSRGAYTARALAGMIGRVGLLNPARYNVDDKDEAYRRGMAAWSKSKGITLSGNSSVTKLANRLLDFIEGFIAHGQLSDADMIKNVPIKSVAVWDTVGSMGIPLYLKNGRFDVFEFADDVLNDRVEHGYQAMAIDELRCDFPISKWRDRAGVEQVWFAGAHADVGGGYSEAESRLSDVTLQWMMGRLNGVGVRLATPLTRMPDCNCGNQQVHEPWEKVPFKLLRRTQREPDIKDRFHSSVIERWRNDSRYRPKALAFVNETNIDRLPAVS